MLHEDLLLADQVEGHACIYIYVDVNVNFLRQGRNRYIVRICLYVRMEASCNSVLLTLYIRIALNWSPFQAMHIHSHTKILVIQKLA